MGPHSLPDIFCDSHKQDYSVAMVKASFQPGTHHIKCDPVRCPREPPGDLNQALSNPWKAISFKPTKILYLSTTKTKTGMWLSEKSTPRISSVLLSSQKSLFPLALVLKVYIKISLYKPQLCFLLAHHEIVLHNRARNHEFSRAKGSL